MPSVRSRVATKASRPDANPAPSQQQPQQQQQHQQQPADDVHSVSGAFDTRGYTPRGLFSLPDGGTGCSCARCSRKQGPVREDTQERVQFVAEILAEVDPGDATAAERLVLPAHVQRAQAFMQAVEANDAIGLATCFDQTDERLQTEIVEQLIISAAQLGHCEIIRTLDKYAETGEYLEVAEPSKDGTPLMFAAHNGHTAAVRLLLELGADPHAIDLNGYTALMICTFADRGSAAEVICRQEDVDVDSPDSKERTAFSYAAMYGAEHCAQVLAAAGADVFVRDYQGKDPLELAIESMGKPSCVELIKRLQFKARMAARHEARKQDAADKAAGMLLTDEELLRKQAEADASAMKLLMEVEAENAARLAKEAAAQAKRATAKKGLAAIKAKDPITDSQQPANGAVAKAAPEVKAPRAGAKPPPEPPTPPAPAPGPSAPPPAAADKKGAAPAGGAAAGAGGKAGAAHAAAGNGAAAHAAKGQEELRQEWEALLDEANKCREAQRQPQLLSQIQGMIDTVAAAGISLKWGRKVLQRLEAVGPARQALKDALSAKPIKSSVLSAAIKAARQASSLLEPHLVPEAEAALEQALEDEDAAKWRALRAQMTGFDAPASGPSPGPSAPAPAAAGAAAAEQAAAPRPPAAPASAVPASALITPTARVPMAMPPLVGSAALGGQPAAQPAYAPNHTWSAAPGAPLGGSLTTRPLQAMPGSAAAVASTAGGLGGLGPPPPLIPNFTLLPTAPQAPAVQPQAGSMAAAQAAQGLGLHRLPLLAPLTPLSLAGAPGGLLPLTASMAAQHALAQHPQHTAPHSQQPGSLQTQLPTSALQSHQQYQQLLQQQQAAQAQAQQLLQLQPPLQPSPQHQQGLHYKAGVYPPLGYGSNAQSGSLFALAPGAPIIKPPARPEGPVGMRLGGLQSLPAAPSQPQSTDQGLGGFFPRHHSYSPTPNAHLLPPQPPVGGLGPPGELWRNAQALLPGGLLSALGPSHQDNSPYQPAVLPANTDDMARLAGQTQGLQLGGFKPASLQGSAVSHAPQQGGLVGGSDDAECVVCLDRERSVIVLPCSHFCVCQPCAAILRRAQSPTCPMCARTIEDTIEIEN